jgi:superfamily II DNA helicase RecQ
MFIAPERFQMKDQRDAFKKLNIANIIFDEAHCVSQWGHDFRTSYLLIGDSIQKHFKDVKIMALTGTASCNVLTDIKRDLCLTKNVKIITINSFRRKELIFGVLPYDNIELEERAKEESPINKYLYQKIIKERGKYYKKDGKYNYGVIVFCPYAAASKKRSVPTVDFCRSFESYCKTHNIDDVDAGIYHGQLDADDKKEVQDKFVNNEINILFATKAFGMGIDKPNISATIHSCLPESVEAFYQEAGRAGRNGNKAYCVIMASCDAENPCDYSETKDSKIYEFFLENSYPEKNKFKQSIIDVMNKKYIKAKTITTNIAKAIADNAILNTKKITFSNANNFKISIDKSTTGFVVYFDDDNNVKVEPKVPVDSSNITQQMFVEDIAEKAASQYSKYNATTFKRWFNKLTYTADNSLCEILDSGEKHECCIEEPSKIKGNENYDLYFLHNAIQSLILEYKKMQNAGDIKTNRKDFVISNEHLYKIQLINQDLEEHKNSQKYKLKNIKEEENFKDRIKQRCNSILEEICIYNQMPSKKINIDEYYHSNYTEKIGITETEQKVIYYLGRLNIYSEYERGYYPNNYIKIQTNIVTKESLFEAVKNFVKSYETNDYANKTVTMDKIFKDIPQENDKISDYVIAAMNYIIDYSYEKIRTYRRMQSMIIYDSIREYLIRLNAGDQSAKLENGIYRYFEAKYTDELARDVNGNDNIKLTMDWIDKIELPYKNKEKILSHNANATPENNSNNFKEDLSHLRASAQKIFVSMDKAYTPYFLYAYGIFNDDTLDIDDGIEKFLEGCKRISDVRKNYKRELSRICTRYFSTTDLQYLQEIQKHLEKIKEDSNIKIMKEVLQKQINKVEEELSQEEYAKQKSESNKYEFGTEVLPDQEIPF